MKNKTNKIALSVAVLFLSFFTQSFATEKKPSTPNPSILACCYPIPDTLYYPSHFRKIYSKEFNGKSLELDDGSIWKIRPSDAIIVERTWHAQDAVIISPCSVPGFTGYQYYMTNQRTGSYVYVVLNNGPIIGGIQTNEIISLNPTTGDIIVRNGSGIETYFQIDPREKPFINDWFIGQAVIVGSNDNYFMNCWCSKCDHILINSERNRYVRAFQY